MRPRDAFLATGMLITGAANTLSEKIQPFSFPPQPVFNRDQQQQEQFLLFAAVFVHKAN